MTNFLIKTFIKNHENINTASVREGYGKLAGVVGILSNTLISSLKIAVGIIVNSIAVIADGVNNLTDAASSVITLIGFKMAAKAGDQEHPYGHARYEYIAGMVVSAIIIIVGFNLLTSSVEKIRHPEPLSFNYWIIAILLVSVGVKIWQALFNIRLGKIINSSTLKATGADSRNDVIATSAVLISVLIGHFTGYNIDGYMGLLVAVFIMYSGIMLIKETSSPLLGQAPDPDLVKAIEGEILSYPAVLGVHDLVVHDYGPGNKFASVHIEVDAYENILKSHDLIDNIESNLWNKLNIDLVAHMDPVDTKDPLVSELSLLIRKLTEPLPHVSDFHDLRIIKGDTHTNVIFDMVLTIDNNDDRAKLKKYLQDSVSQTYPNFILVIKYDLDYSPSR